MLNEQVSVLQARQARLSAVTSPTMLALSKMTEPTRFAAWQAAYPQELAPGDALTLQSSRGKFAGILTRVVFSADDRGLMEVPEQALTAEDLVRGVISSYLLAKRTGAEPQEPLYDLAHYWTRKLPNSPTMVPLAKGALHTADAMETETQKLYDLLNPGVKQALPVSQNAPTAEVSI